MACAGCSCSTGKDSSSTAATKGCGSTGGCSTGGCNKKNTYDYITAMGITDPEPFEMVEVSFKNGARKEFYRNPAWTRCTTGDWVMVETGGGFDIGRVGLSGELVKLQMKKRRVKSDYRFNAVIRKANERDMERYQEIREWDQPAMVKARAISRTVHVDMKISDVEFQADGRKATFYYTAQGRIDFRELIRLYARDFRVKIEMRQIGARQETARLGGIGPCGRELCCSTWLTDFKSVSTAAARYQNIAINQTKLSGQCGRLKCCLNYELDTYIEALDEFPDHADRIQLATGRAMLIKTDVFKRLMYYAVEGERGKLYVLPLDTVKEILEMAKRGEKPVSLADLQLKIDSQVDSEELDYEAVNDVLDLPAEERRKKKKKKKKPGDRPDGPQNAGPRTAGNGPRPAQPRREGDDRRPENRPDRPKMQVEKRADGIQKEGENQAPPRRERDDRRPQNRPERPQNQGENRPENQSADGQNQPRRNDRPPQNRPDRPQNQGENRPENQSADGQNQPQNQPRRENRPPQNRPDRPQNQGEKRPDNRPPRAERPPGGEPSDGPQNQQPGGENRRNDHNKNRNRGPRNDQPKGPDGPAGE